MAKIVLSGEVGYDITLYKTVQLVQEAKQQGEITILDVDVTSEGGSSVEGRDLYDYFTGLKNSGIHVNMNAIGYVCSAALTFFCAGSNRTAQNNETEFLMHSPKFAPNFFDSIRGISENELEMLKKGVAEEKQLLVKIYSAALGIEADTINALMDKDEVITSEAAKSLGMIHNIGVEQIETPLLFNYKIAAKYYANKNEQDLLIKIENKMEKEKIDKLVENQEEQKGMIANLIDKVTNAFKTEQVTNLNVNAEDGTMIELVGDVLEVDAETVTPDAGTFTVNYEEKMWTVVIEGNKVTELTEVEEEEVIEDDVEALKAEIETLKTQLEDANNSNTETSNKLTEIENKHNENQKLVDKLRGIESKMFNEDGSVNFDNIKNIEPKEEKTTGKSMAATIRESKESK